MHRCSAVRVGEDSEFRFRSLGWESASTKSSGLLSMLFSQNTFRKNTSQLGYLEGFYTRYRSVMIMDLWIISTELSQHHTVHLAVKIRNSRLFLCRIRHVFICDRFLSTVHRRDSVINGFRHVSCIFLFEQVILRLSTQTTGSAYISSDLYIEFL